MPPIVLSLIVTLATIFPSLASADALTHVTSQRQRVADEIRIDAVVEARRQATLSAQVAGTVEEVNFDVADIVKQGAVLLRIRDQSYRANQLQAAAALDEASVGLADAEREFKRSEDLRRRKLVSEAQFDLAQAAVNSARARRDAAQAALSSADEQLGHTVLRAPYSGVVIERHVEPGEAVTPGQPIISGYAAGELRISAQVPQSLIASLRLHRRARVVLLDDGREIEVGKITIHPFADPANHAFPVRIDLPAGETGLFPGMLVKLAISTGESERLLLPRQALVARAEINAVYVIDAEGGVSFRQVRPGNRFADKVEILAGLDEGERVALDPVRAGIEYKRQREVSR